MSYLAKNPILGEELGVHGDGNLAPTAPPLVDQRSYGLIADINTAEETAEDSCSVTSASSRNTSFTESTLSSKRFLKNAMENTGPSRTKPFAADNHDNLGLVSRRQDQPPPEQEIRNDRMGWMSRVKVCVLVLILLVVVVIAYVLAIPYLAPSPNDEFQENALSSDISEESSTPSVHPTTSKPSTIPTPNPSTTPSEKPTELPTPRPSTLPSNLASQAPTIDAEPTISPSQNPTLSPTFENATSIFYAIGDVPYRSQEKVELAQRMRELPQDGDFLIHVGDFRSAQDPTVRCSFKDYVDVRRILLQSKIPVFIIPGGKLLIIHVWDNGPFLSISLSS